jgi:hypothetical protein
MLPAPVSAAPQAPAAPASASANDNQSNARSLQALRAQFEHFAEVKASEIDEQRTAWRYYHGKQLTDKQLKTLEKRKQPVIIFNRVGRKIDGTVGIIQKLRGDPKVFPRGPSSEDAAELATNVIRSVIESAHFASAIETDCLRECGVAGLAVCEMSLDPGPNGDLELDLAYVDHKTFFYDPRSVRLDFSDAKFMGVSKWMDREDVQAMFPDQADAVYDGMADVAETAFDSDQELLWMQAPDRVRLVEHWYKVGAQWRVKFHCGTVELLDKPSPFVDDKGQSIPRYFAFRWGCDDEGISYGLTRNLKGPQDAINQHRSKAAHIMNTRQIRARKGALGGDIERARLEAARPDGIIEVEGDVSQVVIEKADSEFLQQTEYFQDAKSEIENFGPNPALLGDDDIKNRSGRALNMLQQAGVTELGPFLSSYKGWKLRLYRAIWANARKYWTQARILRVADVDDPEAPPQFIPVNQVRPDPTHPAGFAMVNRLANVDVDVNIEEGPDTANVMGDVFDLLSSLASNAVPVPPPVLIEASALPSSKKKQLIRMMQEAAQQPPPAPPVDPLKAQELQQRGELDAQRLQLDAQKLMRDAELDRERSAAERAKAEAALASEATKRQEAAASIELEHAKVALQREQIKTERQKQRLEALRLKAEISASDRDAALERAKLGHEASDAEAERSHKAELAKADRESKERQTKAAALAKPKAQKAA